MTDLQRTQKEQAAAKKLIRKKKRVKQNKNGYWQPMHDYITYHADWAMEEQLIRADFACARAAATGGRG